MNLDTYKGLLTLIKRIFFVTVLFEVLGAMLSFIVFSKDFSPWKALGISFFHSIAAFNNSGFDILGALEKAGRKSVCSQSYLYVAFTNEKERDNFALYYNTKFFRFLVSTLKTTQSATNKYYANVPLQDFTENSDIDWSKSVAEIDQQLYAKYNLNEEDINAIETTIAPMK